MKSVSSPLVSLASFGLLALAGTALCFVPGCGGKDLRGAPGEFQTRKKAVDNEDDGLDDPGRGQGSQADGTAADGNTSTNPGAGGDTLAGEGTMPAGGGTMMPAPGGSTQAPGADTGVGMMNPPAMPTMTAMPQPTMTAMPQPTMTAMPGMPVAYTFNADVKPLAVSYCQSCHGANSGHDFKPSDAEQTWKNFKADALARIKSGDMPRGSKRPSAAEKDVMVKWLESL